MTKVGRDIGTWLRAAVAPAAYKARRALGKKAASLEQAATRTWVVAPGHEEEVTPLFVAEGHLDKIRLGSNGETPQEVVEKIVSTKHAAAPTMAYLLKDVVLADANLYAGMFKEDLYGRRGIPEFWFAPHGGAISSGVLASTYSGSRWFGHFMHDELPLQLLAPTLGQPVVHRRREYVHEAGWRAALGVATPPAYNALFAKELIVLRDFAQNRSKQERCVELRRRVEHLPRGAERIYLRRDSRGGDRRVLVNEEAVMQRLTKEGFAIVEPAAMSVEEILRTCMGAKVVVSVEGSHTSLILYCGAKGARMLNLYPPYRVSLLGPRMSRSYEVKGGMFVCDPVGESRCEFTADAEEVMRAVEGMCKGSV